MDSISNSCLKAKQLWYLLLCPLSRDLRRMRGKFVNTPLYINCGFSSIRRRFGNASKISSAPGFCKQLWQCLDLRVPLPHTQCPHFFCHIAFLLSRLRFHPADERQTPLEQHLKSVAGTDFWLRASILQHILLVIKFLTSAPSFSIFVFVVFSPHTTYCNNVISILF